jgi:HAMP domain-containing protein
VVTGRFDQSFVIRTIRDFLIALVLVIGLELAGRLGLAWYQYEGEDAEATALAAERLASDVRGIMLNRGGPVAARTIYPILERDYEALGFEVAIVPSEVTIESIKLTHGFEPRGIKPQWREGVHHEAVVALTADEFCTSCHSLAKPGDELGHVVVRNYRDSRLAEWWAEARLTAVVGMGNALIHTMVLFLLLRLRMEPLIYLRSTLAQLARGRLDLSPRAKIRSDDEFGGLACDLNEFMDRLEHLLEDLHGVLRQVGAVNTRLAQVSDGARTQAKQIQEVAQSALAEVFRIRELPQAERGAALERLGTKLVDMSRVIQEDGYYLSEIRVLEERMRAVAEGGRSLLERIGTTEDAPATETPARRPQPAQSASPQTESPF